MTYSSPVDDAQDSTVHAAAIPVEVVPERDAPDFWIALVAGESVWVDVDEPILGMERWASALEIISFAWCTVMLWVGWHVTDDATWVLPVVGTIGVAVLATRPARVLAWHRSPSSLAWSFVVRATMVMAIGVSGLLLGPIFGFLVALSMAAALGVEASLCAWALGIPIEPVPWIWSFLRSPLHLGVIGAVIGAILNIGSWHAVVVALTVYVMILSSVLGGIVFASATERFRWRLAGEIQVQLDSAIATEHRQSAHWLHDDVSSELKLVQLKLQAADLTADQVAVELGDLDHRLRLRQLDELFASGSVSLAEILQPFVRRAQSLGLQIMEVPTFDDASTIVGAATARQFERAVSNATYNAITAGATRLGFTVRSDDTQITLSITDDAGGFDLSTVPAGRGLWQLSRELGSGHIDVSPVEDGSMVTIHIDRHPRRATEVAERPGAGSGEPDEPNRPGQPHEPDEPNGADGGETAAR